MSPSLREKAERLDAQLHRLKQRFVDLPSDAIPEMTLLTDDDWLKVAGRLNIDSDADVLERAMSNIRTAAKLHLGVALMYAYADFARANPGKAPESPADLVPFFRTTPEFDPTTVTPEMLNRYTVVGGDKVLLVETTSPDETLDQRGIFGPRLQFERFTDLRPDTERALAALREARGLAPREASDLLPYFTPELSESRRAIFLREAERLLKNAAQNP